jgi:hypothetical protein
MVGGASALDRTQVSGGVCGNEGFNERSRLKADHAFMYNLPAILYYIVVAIAE